MLLGTTKGYLYGTTAQGGAFNFGTVFKVSLTGTHTVMWNFTGGTDGGGPNPGLIFNKQGHIVGTTSGGGAFGLGLVFVAYQNALSEVYSFTGSGDGTNPRYGVVRDKLGNLYGTTEGGGANFLGTVFEVKMGPPITETVLYSFTGGPDDGYFPIQGVILDQNGDLNGTTPDGGDPDCNDGYGCGVVFRVTP
jgi:uncharacterized repeat protein (TIGR03803 family)